MLDIRRLEILQRFALRGTIVATAADLGYSPSAISQQLTTLEQEAGVPLLERTARRASLTDAGKELADHARLILAAVETAQSRMRARATTISGRLTVSCIPGLAPVLAPRLAQAQRAYPGLSIVALESSSRSAADAVVHRLYDIAVVDHWGPGAPSTSSGLVAHHLCQEEVLLAVPDDHPLTAQPGPVTAARLRAAVSDETWLCAPEGHFSRVAGDKRLSGASAEPARRWEFEGLHVLAAVIATGAGIGLIPAQHLRDHQGAAGLHLSPPLYRTLLALSRDTIRGDPALETCLATIVQTFSAGTDS